MFELTSEQEQEVLTIRMAGTIDSTNSAEAEKLLKAQYEGKNFGKMILDFSEMTYLSSAGLRVMLHINKAVKNLEIIHVSEPVYRIFEMTGFTEMIEIKRAYRKLDLTGCDVIGRGSNGTVYRYTDDIVVKVYHNNDALADIHRERELAKTALVLGVNTAIPYDVAQIGDHYGSVFELLSSKTVTQLIQEDPENLEKYVMIFTDLLKTIHQTEVKPGLLPKAKDQYRNYADFLEDYLEPAQTEKLRALIETAEESDRMVHGDYHTSNVYYANDEAILIDMDTLSVGSPVFEFASIYLAYRGFNEIIPDSSIKFMKLDAEICRRIWKEILNTYFEGMPQDELEICEAKFRLLGYTRLLRRTIRRTPDQKESIAYLKEQLIRLLDTTENLVI